MTGKEALNHIVNGDYNEMICTYPSIPAYNGMTQKDMMKLIEKDLEFLEILKPYIRVYKDVIPNGTIYYFVNGLETDKETYEKVKEWLENDKQRSNRIY